MAKRVTLGQLDDFGQRLLDGRITLDDMYGMLHWPEAKLPETLLKAYCKLVHLCHVGQISREEMQVNLDLSRPVTAA